MGHTLSIDAGVHRFIQWVILFPLQGLAAGVLCKFSLNDGWIPVNKNLWYVLNLYFHDADHENLMLDG